MPNWDDAVSGLHYWTTEQSRLWRVSHLDFMARRWAVASLTFHIDLDCSNPVNDAASISSGYVIDFEMEKGLDNDVTTEWLSACDRCNPHQGWLGIHMPQPRWVQCVQIFHSVRPLVGSRGVALDRWDGNAWKEEVVIRDLDPSTWKFMYFPHSSVTQYDGRARWRVASAFIVEERWRVASISFYLSDGCTNKASGIEITSGYTRGHSTAAAFDDDKDTYWESSCRRCGSLSIWLGLSLPVGLPVVRCVQLRQV